MTTLLLGVLVAQTQFVTAVGDTALDEAWAVAATADGYALAGFTKSVGAGNEDFLVVKLDTAGAVLWARAVGGPGVDSAHAVLATADGGYLVAGATSSYGAGGYDALLAKFDGAGTLQWARTVGGTGDEGADALLATTDGGCVAVGYTTSVGAGGADALVFRVDSAGNVLWATAAGGSGSDYAHGLAETPSGDVLLVTGETDSYGAGGTDAFIAAFDTVGAYYFCVVFGGAANDMGRAVAMRDSGTVVVVGATYSFGAGNDDLLLVAVDSTLSVVWSQAVGTASYEFAYDFLVEPDMSMLVAGYRYSAGAGAALLLKLDPSVTPQWTRLVGGSVFEAAYGLTKAADGGYALAGASYSFAAGEADAFAVKTDVAGATCLASDVYPTQTLLSLTATTAAFSSAATGFAAASASPTVTNPTLAETTVCYSQALTERSPVARTPALTARLVRGGLSISVTSPTGVAVYAAAGRLVRTLTVTGTARVTLTPGVYVLRDERGNTLTAVVAR